MSDLKASVSETSTGFHVEGYEKIEYDFTFLDGVFEPQNAQLAKLYERWGRCLAIMDKNIYDLYGAQMQRYFAFHNISLQVHQTMIGEKAKSLETFTSIVDSMTEFGIIRKEPVLVVVCLRFLHGLHASLIKGFRAEDSSLTSQGKCSPNSEEPPSTDTNSFACAAYRRNTNYIRIPTTVIGLIDASVSIKVAINYGNYKNRLGAYHAPMHTLLDFGFLRTLPEAQVRNGFAELIKISSCAHLPTFDLLDEFCERLIGSKFGRLGDEAYENGHGHGEVRRAADEINRAGIFEMLKLETPNLHEIGLDRVIAYGHTWSPLHEVSYTHPTNSCLRPLAERASSLRQSPSATATPSQSTWPTQQHSP
jgi:3-dehydroquinate synthase